MLGFDILNFCSTVAEVAAQLRQPPILLAILATLPPKSSSLYVHVSLGRELSEVMCKKRWSLGFMISSKPYHLQGYNDHAKLRTGWQTWSHALSLKLLGLGGLLQVHCTPHSNDKQLASWHFALGSLCPGSPQLAAKQMAPEPWS